MSPPRGFTPAEFEGRLARAQQRMASANLDALLLTTEPEVRYYTGYLTRFWESPTRPWFLVLPAAGSPIAVIPSIGSHLMRQSWITDIRIWQAPDYTDDGVGLLADTLQEVVPRDGRIGVADAMESHLRMPLAHFRELESQVLPRRIVSDAQITRTLRQIKSEAEIDKIRHAAAIAGRAFDRVPTIAKTGTPLSSVFRDFQRLCLEEGADWVPYLAGGAGQGGYGDVISPASDAPLAKGDVLMLDTGLVWDGYFCDFDRNFSLGPPSADVADAHHRLVEATTAAFEIARPGARMSDLFHTMNAIVSPGQEATEAGRLGHGLGMQLTEWPSIIPQDHTELAPGMVLTLEPGITLGDGRIMVHEEDILIGERGATFLSPRQNPEIRVI